MTILLIATYLSVGLFYSWIHLQAWKKIKEKYPSYMTTSERIIFFLVFSSRYLPRVLLDKDVEASFLFKKPKIVEKLKIYSTEEIEGLPEDKREAAVNFNKLTESFNSYELRLNPSLMSERINFPPHVLRFDLDYKFENDHRQKFLDLFNLSKKSDELNNFLFWYFIYGSMFWGIRVILNFVCICFMISLGTFILFCTVVIVLFCLLFDIFSGLGEFISKLRPVKYVINKLA